MNVTDWTFEVWFRDENSSYNHARARILTKGDIASTEVPYFASIENNLLTVGLRSAGSPYTLTFNLATGAVTPAAWHHLAASFQANSRTLTIYIDGAQRAQGVLGAASVGNTLPLIIGRSGAVGNYWKGKLDDLRLWNVVRTATEIQANYRTQLNGSPAGLVGNWRFDEGMGVTAADSAGTPQNANLLGGAGWSTESPFLAWRSRATMPTARNALGAVTANNGRIYAIGGNTGGALDVVEEYDPGTDTWRSRASMPTARRELGVVLANNGRIYAIGGWSGGAALATVEEYDPVLDSWTSRTPMPTARWGLGVAQGANGRIYAIGGFNGSSNLGTVEEYDPTAGTWATRASMPTARSSLGVAAASNGRIYAIGGRLGGTNTYFATVEEYDPVPNTWAARASISTSRGYVGVAAPSPARLYVIGGFNGSYFATVEAYDIATNQWSSQTSLAGPRGAPGATVAVGRIYAIGGDNQSGFLGSVEEGTVP